MDYMCRYRMSFYVTVFCYMIFKKTHCGAWCLSHSFKALSVSWSANTAKNQTPSLLKACCWCRQTLSSPFCIPLLAHADMLQYIWELRAKSPLNVCVYQLACLIPIKAPPTSVILWDKTQSPLQTSHREYLNFSMLACNTEAFYLSGDIQ